MIESDILRDLLKYLRENVEGKKRGVILKHADAFTAGIPDFSVTWKRKTSWYEVKHTYSSDTISGTDLQWLTARRLSQAGHCYYLIYQSHGQMKRIDIVKPEDIVEGKRFRSSAGFQYQHLFDHQPVLDFIKKIHG